MLLRLGFFLVLLCLVSHASGATIQRFRQDWALLTPQTFGGYPFPNLIGLCTISSSYWIPEDQDPTEVGLMYGTGYGQVRQVMTNIANSSALTVYNFDVPNVSTTNIYNLMAYSPPLDRLYLAVSDSGANNFVELLEPRYFYQPAPIWISRFFDNSYTWFAVPLDQEAKAAWIFVFTTNWNTTTTTNPRATSIVVVDDVTMLPTQIYSNDYANDLHTPMFVYFIYNDLVVLGANDNNGGGYLVLATARWQYAFTTQAAFTSKEARPYRIGQQTYLFVAYARGSSNYLAVITVPPPGTPPPSAHEIPVPASVLTMTMGADSAFNDVLYLGCSDGTVYMINNLTSPTTIPATSLIQINNPSYVDGTTIAAVELVFNYLKVVNNVTNTVTGVPVLIAGRNEGRIQALIGDDPDWQQLAYPYIWEDLVGGGVTHFRFVDTQPINRTSPATATVSLAAGIGSSAEIEVLNTSERWNFLVATPSQKYLYTERRVFTLTQSEYIPPSSTHCHSVSACYVALLDSFASFWEVEPSYTFPEWSDWSMSTHEDYVTLLSQLDFQSVTVNNALSPNAIKNAIDTNNIVQANCVSSDASHQLLITIYGYKMPSHPSRGDYFTVVAYVPNASGTGPGSTKHIKYENLFAYVQGANTLNWNATTIVGY